MNSNKNNLSLKEWEEAINKMSYEELQAIVTRPDCWYPKYLELAENRQKELEIAEKKNTIIRVITEMGCECEFDEYEQIDFTVEIDNCSDEIASSFKDIGFSIEFDNDYRFLRIYEYCWKNIELDDVNEVEKVKSAINLTNCCCTRVVTTYYIDKKEHVMRVSCGTCVPYLSNDDYLKESIYARTWDMFQCNRVLNEILENEDML